MNATAPARILIVDDTQKNIQLLGTLLRKENFLLNVAYDGEQAIEIARKLKPELILLDIMMPGIDGYETCARLKALEETQEIPVIFLTAKTEVRDIIRGFEVGAVDYVTKPFNAVVLLSRVRTHLKLRRAQMELAEKNAALEEMVMIDGLTGLYNHKFIFEVLSKQIADSERYGRPMSVIMFDLDHFKRVNDNYGHQVGDEVLVKVAACIKSSVRQADLAGRYGGEEFLVVLPNTSLEDAARVAEKIRSAIASIPWDHEGLVITISGGLAQFRGETELELIDRADKLLYEAKNNGRNRIVQETKPD
ncbi:MAG: PleD family two-component system response regulator [bacterium]|nr:PleD family two-component system response regulator [bacterium]